VTCSNPAASGETPDGEAEPNGRSRNQNRHTHTYRHYQYNAGRAADTGAAPTPNKS